MTALPVLLVDDQRSTRLMVKSILERAKYRVCECSTGQDALEALARERFRFALVDLNLPDMSGVQLLQRAAARDLPPVLGITSLPTAALMSSAQSAGMCGVLKKPITYEQLIAATTAALQVGAPPERVVFGERPIDPDALSEIREVGDDSMIEQFVSQAIDDAHRCLEELSRAAMRRDDSLWKMTAHTLHGVALTLGAQRLASAAADAIPLSGEELAERAERIHRNFAKLLEEAKAHLAEHLRLLTCRERDCLRLAAAGHGTKGIAEKLTISEPTVNFHLNNAAAKLNARGRVQTVARAVKLGAI
jgi:DNA-binding NarL/FixJ family response regulator